MTSQKSGVAILGIFVADLAFRAARTPGIGETIAGSGFKMGPGGHRLLFQSQRPRLKVLWPAGLPA